MSGETARQESGWTVDTLKQHYDQRFIDLDVAVQAALKAAEKAVTKAETAADKRFELLNELRSGVATTADLETVEKLLSELKDRVGRIEDVKTGSELTVGKIFAAIGAVGVVISMTVLLVNEVFK